MKNNAEKSKKIKELMQESKYPHTKIQKQKSLIQGNFQELKDTNSKIEEAH